MELPSAANPSRDTLLPAARDWTLRVDPSLEIQIIAGSFFNLRLTKGYLKFEFVLIRTPNENSVLPLEAPEKRESESSGPIFRSGGCNLEGCVRETEISLQTESAADWAGGARKA